MATQLHKVVEALGYAPKEAKVYLASLALGEAHITDISAKVKMPRTSVQAIVDRLHRDGLMNFYVTRRYKYWVAENPEHLLSMLKERQQVVTAALPHLIELRKQGRRGRAAHTISKEDLGPIRSMADEVAQPVMVTDEDETIVYVNARWQELFGYSLNEVFGQTPRICQSGETPHEVYNTMWQTLDEGRLFQTDKVIDKDKDGNTFSMLTTIFPLRHHGKLFYVQILEKVATRINPPALNKALMGVVAATTTVLSFLAVDIAPVFANAF